MNKRLDVNKDWMSRWIRITVGVGNLIADERT